MSRRRLIRLVRLSNRPFALKMAVCPALAMALLTAMGLQGILAANHQATLINTVVHHDLSVAMRLSGSAVKLQEINSDLYRLATLQASNAADLNITNEFEAWPRGPPPLPTTWTLRRATST